MKKTCCDDEEKNSTVFEIFNSILFSFQECFNSPYGTQYFKEYAEKIPGESTQKLSAVAKECSIYLVGGSLFLVTASVEARMGNMSTGAIE